MVNVGRAHHPDDDESYYPFYSVVRFEYNYFNGNLMLKDDFCEPFEANCDTGTDRGLLDDLFCEPSRCVAEYTSPLLFIYLQNNMINSHRHKSP